MLDEVELSRLIDEVPAPEALASAEFSESWKPGNDDREGLVGDRNVSMTPEAIDKMRDQERRIAAAKTVEEKASAAKDIDIYRVSLVFSGEEAKIVKDVLGDQPAVTLLGMCKENLGLA
jgi:hypothetical protein